MQQGRETDTLVRLASSPVSVPGEALDNLLLHAYHPGRLKYIVSQSTCLVLENWSGGKGTRKDTKPRWNPAPGLARRFSDLCRPHLWNSRPRVTARVPETWGTVSVWPRARKKVRWAYCCYCAELCTVQQSCLFAD